MIIGTEVSITIYCALGVCVFTVYLAYDMKTIIGGGKVQISPDEYVLAVVEEQHKNRFFIILNCPFWPSVRKILHYAFMPL